VRFAEPVRDRLSIPCAIIADDETKIVAQLADADVLVSMGFTQEMATAGPRLRLVQVPGAGLDRIDRRALRPGTGLANTYGHEAGIAEYIIGAMIALYGVGQSNQKWHFWKSVLARTMSATRKKPGTT
jgi:phosphoglycerate dehydrogenase-like enzyme